MNVIDGVETMCDNEHDENEDDLQLPQQTPQQPETLQELESPQHIVEPNLELTTEQLGIWDRLNELRARVDLRERLPSLTGVSKSRVEEELRIVEAVACLIGTDNITETNNLIYACTVVVTERLGIRPRRKKEDIKSLWKRDCKGS